MRTYIKISLHIPSEIELYSSSTQSKHRWYKPSTLLALRGLLSIMKIKVRVDFYFILLDSLLETVIEKYDPAILKQDKWPLNKSDFLFRPMKPGLALVSLKDRRLSWSDSFFVPESICFMVSQGFLSHRTKQRSPRNANPGIF